jgi:hypothetical protein
MQSEEPSAKLKTKVGRKEVEKAMLRTVPGEGEVKKAIRDRV